jgi:hypothetical protein
VATNYSGFAIDLVIDLAAIMLMGYVLYFRRHWRADLLLSYVTLNIGIFVVMSVLSLVRVDIAVGFGLFAILSIIRLRSSAVTQQEVAYYFVALVMGLVNGMDLADRTLVVALNLLLLVVMAVFDSKPLRERSRRVDVQLKKVYADEAALVVDLERQLGGRVMYHEVTEVDLGRQHTTVDVRYRPGVGVMHQDLDATSATGADPRQLETTTDTAPDQPQHLDVTTASESDQPEQLAVASAVQETDAGLGARRAELVSLSARDSGGDRSDHVE